MCMSIGFILSGCNQSLTDLSKYPPIDNSDEKYLYNRFNQKILVYNTNLNTVVKEITENNFFQYEFPQQTDIYISGHSFDNDFEVLKITDKKIQSLLKLKKNEGVFPVANNENYHIMIRSFYDSNNIEIELPNEYSEYSYETLLTNYTDSAKFSNVISLRPYETIVYKFKK